jgi:hypothetical protein
MGIREKKNEPLCKMEDALIPFSQTEQIAKCWISGQAFWGQ